ncbi:LamG-like jellyroll fold domain-containing protein [Kitasatospora cineracea]|uniref:Concanavalin A-like lectin/glucanase superfamily protein n=1 Tax=Kitasatospora cineracea TaxID=88074 RepID=A0A3N4R4B1_9ACTN|nr:LamG-like jellyroll fold domain-containing protein [Kitasatospora cineracea]RPE28032.1 concanavalin A-like lectin/glucanase superfamily protein [Kitasatospora cineracea]
MSVPPQETAETLAVAESRRTGKPVEVEALKSESSDVVAQPDGKLVSTTYVQPKRVRRAGGWVDLDPTLAVLPSGAVAPKVATVGVEFSGGGSDRPLVRMSRAGKELKFTWPKALPAPVLVGETAEYRSILPDVDLKLTASTTGFSQVLVVHSPEAAKNPELAPLRLGLEGDGLTVEQESDGSLKAVDPSGGGTVFEAPVPVMWDSATAAGVSAASSDASKTPLAKSMSATASAGTDAAVTVGTVPGEGAKMTRLKVELPRDGMVLTPDQAMLDDPSTVYPVMIDPAWNTPNAADWAGVSRYYPDQQYWHFTYTSTYVHDWGVGYCGDTSRCAPLDVKRAFFQIPSGAFIGKRILRAEFGTYESHSYSCDARTVELWNTNYIYRGLTWNDQTAAGFWSRHLEDTSSAKGGGGTCPDGWLEFGGTTGPVKTLVQDAAKWGWSTITFGLKAQNESDTLAWKRFTDDAFLRVQYNLQPDQVLASDMWMQPGSGCHSTSVKVNQVPQVSVRAVDPDGDAIGVQFAANWDSGDGMRRHWWSTGAEDSAPPSTDFKGSGSTFSYRLPDSLPKNTPLSWEVRAWDGASWGLWSSDGDPTACYFDIDTTRPNGPTITSATYPGSMSKSDELPWTDGVGRYGSFTLKASSSDVVKYQWSLDGSDPKFVATTGGAAQTVQVMPETSKLHHITAEAIDAAGNHSQPETYSFSVLAGQDQRDGWSMDKDLNGSSAQHPVTLGSGAKTDAAGHLGSALALNGDAQTGYAQTGAAVLDTSRSYSVSAWVKYDGSTTNRVAVSQNGPDYYAFALGAYLISDTYMRWTFKVQSAAGDSDSTTFAVSAPTNAPIGQWAHLTGVYDSEARTIVLYVNGVKAGSTNVPSVLWDGHGPVQIGRDRWKGNWSAGWPGAVDEVKLWDRPLSAADAVKVAADQQLTTGTPAKAVWSFDGKDPMAGAGESDALVASGGVQSGVPGVSGKAVSTGAAGYLRTARPQVDGARDFSVSAWVKLPKPAAGDSTAKVAVGQIGQHNSEFALYYSPYWGRWIFGRYKEDTSADTLVRTSQSDCTAGTVIGSVPCFAGTSGEWTHLVGVNDTTAKKTRLYINGYLVGESDYTQNSQWANPGPLQIGSANREGANVEFFNGDVDDVRVFDRIITGPEATAMVQQHPVLAGRWKFNTAASGSTPDEGPAHVNATLGGKASIHAGGGPFSTGALTLNGSADYAATTTPPLPSDQSFTIAGWASTAGIPTRNMTVFSLPGANNSAVTLRWHYLGQSIGEWQAEVRTEDGAGATATAVTHSPEASWTHLAVSYDAFTGQLVLYVNGTTEKRTCEVGEADCVPHISFAGAPQPYRATSGLQFGRNRSGGAWGEYFSGELDDVWLYRGVLNYLQVNALASPTAELDTSVGV